MRGNWELMGEKRIPEREDGNEEREERKTERGSGKRGRERTGEGTHILKREQEEPIYQTKEQ